MLLIIAWKALPVPFHKTKKVPHKICRIGVRDLVEGPGEKSILIKKEENNRQTDIGGEILSHKKVLSCIVNSIFSFLMVHNIVADFKVDRLEI